jgi:hypothetical protein
MSDQTPSGKFWSVYAGIGPDGGIATEPAWFSFNLYDSTSGGLSTTCSNAKNDWIYLTQIDSFCAMSGYMGGNVYLSWFVKNADPTYSRIYEISYAAYYQ